MRTPPFTGAVRHKLLVLLHTPRNLFRYTTITEKYGIRQPGSFKWLALNIHSCINFTFAEDTLVSCKCFSFSEI